MTNATGFLIRSNLDDRGTLPRSGDWTQCPDIIVAGPTALSRADMIASYGSVTDRPLSQGLTNYLYLRAKNLNNAPLTQVAYMFQVPGSLVLYPSMWYKPANLVGYDIKKDGATGTPDDPKIIKKYEQTLSAQPGQIVVTDAYTWAPESSEHHCLVGVVADSWNAVLADYPSGGNSMAGLAQWIYSNPSHGWHNVNIQPVTSTIYEAQVAYEHPTAEAAITFTMRAKQVPVGARISFSSNTSTASNETVGVDWTPVSKPVNGGSLNPDFEVGTTITVNQGYKTVVTYRTDFAGQTPPANFSMSMKATVATTPPPNSLMAHAATQDSFLESFHRSHSPTALFTAASSGEPHGEGLDGYRTMLAGAPWDDGDDGDLEDAVVVVVGSHTTTPVRS